MMMMMMMLNILKLCVILEMHLDYLVFVTEARLTTRLRYSFFQLIR